MAQANIAGTRLLADGSLAISLELDQGYLKAEVLEVLAEIARAGVLVHPTTAQKIMLLNVPPEQVEDILARLQTAGALIRQKGTSFQPRVCIGKPYCKLALGETFALAQAIYHRFKGYPVPHKFKVAVSGCPACCSWANIIDLGFQAVRGGYKVFVGGKGGYKPTPGRLLGKAKDQEEALLYMEAVLTYFQRYGEPKRRLATVLAKTGEDPLKEILGEILAKRAS